MLRTSDQKYYEVLPPISFSEEFEQIKQNIEEKKIVFNYRYSVANEKNLRTALRENPIGLHFSGHGFQNNEHLYRGDKRGWAKHKNKGDVLIFENENGSSDFFFTSDLKKLFEEIQQHKIEKKKTADAARLAAELGENENSSRAGRTQPLDDGDEGQEPECKPTDLQFVCVASCHSEQVGRIFLDAGVPHVICIDQTQAIKDKAAIEFSKAFYDEVFDTYKNICDAYSYAKAKVEKAFGKHEAGKIMLLINESTHGGTCPEQPDKRPKRSEIGIFNQIGIATDLIVLPNKVSPFVSRNQDMFDVLRLLSQQNTTIVQIYGMPGLGKSSLLKNVTCFLGERDIYKDGVLYIDFLHVTSFKDAIMIVLAYMKDIEEDQFYQSFSQDDFQRDLERLRAKIHSLDKKFLLALDNLDHLEAGSHEQFLTFIAEVSSSSCKVLFTSNKFSMKYFSEKFCVKKIQKLKKSDSVDLFMKKIPLSDNDKKNFLDFENIQELHRETIKKYGEGSPFVPPLCTGRHAHSTLCITSYLAKHPIFEFLAGIPLVISILAPLSVCKSLSEIFLYLAEKNDGNFQSEVLKHKMDDESLMHCLEYCTQHFQEQKGSNLLDLWYLIGMQGPGILFDDLKEVLSQDDKQPAALQHRKEQQEGSGDPTSNPEGPVSFEATLEKDLEDLIGFSLIEQECLDKAGTVKRLRVSPFVGQYIQNKMNKQMKRDTLNIACVHLKEKLVDYKKEYSQNICQCTSLDEIYQLESKLCDQIKPYEQQIIHLVDQMITLAAGQEEEQHNEERQVTEKSEVAEAGSTR